MANNGTSTEAERQRQAEQRARRRASIRSEINALNTRIDKVNSQIDNLTTEHTNLNTYSRNWNTQESLYNGNDILSEVVIVNVFEGVCADKIKEKMEGCILDMDQTYISVSGLIYNVHSQISRLNQYVSTIKAKITSLNNELSTL